MKAFDYLAPADLAEAVDLLAEHGDQASVISGGQSLLLAMKQREQNPRTLVSVTRIPELCGVASGPDDHPLAIGATTTYAMLDRWTFEGWQAEIGAVAGNLADRPVRTMGTVGGALCQADPRFDFPCLVVALDARIELRSADGSRQVPASEFVRPGDGGPRPGEILTSIEVPALTRFTGFAFEKFRFRAFDAALASVGCAARVEDGRVRELRVAVGAVQAAPVLAQVAAELADTTATDVDVVAAGRAVAEEARPLSSAGTDLQRYQHELVAVLARKAIARALDQTRS